MQYFKNYVEVLLLSFSDSLLSLVILKIWYNMILNHKRRAFRYTVK